jgi:hypothetical protein
MDRDLESLCLFWFDTSIKAKYRWSLRNDTSLLLGIFLLAVRRRKPDYGTCIALGGVLSVYVYINYVHRPSMPMSLTNILMSTYPLDL